MKKLLPIGSVVKPRGKHSVEMMIIGYYAHDNTTNTSYDYSAVVYPQGIMSENSIYLLNEDSIADVIFQGYSDEEGNRLIMFFHELIANLEEELKREED